MLDRNRLIQQCSISTNPDSLSPEPAVENKNGINKCHSSSNITKMAENGDERSQIKGLSKSISGGNINNHAKNEISNERCSTSSASGISSPSNNSQREEEEK